MVLVYSMATSAFRDQIPKTAGLRKIVSVFQQEHYLENYVQAIFDSIGQVKGETLIIGGDGRYYNGVATQKIITLAVANGLRRVVIGKNGILSTPAASNLIRKYGAKCGIILSASHNPGGPTGDFGVKYNIANGGPAPDKYLDAVCRVTQAIFRYQWAEVPTVDLSRMGELKVGDTTLEIVDPVLDYAALLESIFDFASLRRLFEGGFRLHYDAMHAVTGPYAKEIFEVRLGAEAGTVSNSIPLPDFGGQPPDPGPLHSKALFDLMSDPSKCPDMAAASDGDGDRHLVLGKHGAVSASDALAIFAANARLIPRYSTGLRGVARSMPTSRAVDAVAERLRIPLFETGTGYKFFGNLLDAGKVTFCGEESGGIGADHVREKDGLWAILFWLSIVAARRQSIQDVVTEHWAQYGRQYFLRHDFEFSEPSEIAGVLDRLKRRATTLKGRKFGNLVVWSAENFCYSDPVDRWDSPNEGLRIVFEGGGRAVLRMSGTGTSGGTLRMYFDRHEREPGKFALDPADALFSVIDAANHIMRNKLGAPSATSL